MAIYVLCILTKLTGGMGNIGENQISDKDPACENCGCCAPGACIIESGEDICNDVCLTGFHGIRCLNRCPDNCISCKDHPNASSGDRSLWGIGYCTVCKEGYYSTKTLFQCQSSCKPGSGYFINNMGDCKSCPRKCIMCKSAEKCEICRTGYYEPPRGLNLDICEPCPHGCLHCLPYQKYDECKPEF